ncbi:MAG: hypothetical protein Tsb006_3050 [Rickettsiaceae bacterium]
MFLEANYSQKKYLYDQHLNQIKDIRFTHREIDIIACVLHNRGEKKIASLLLISPRTVSTHIHNIMLKIGHGSREFIIDFVEKSGKLQLVKQYYLCILGQNSFEKKLTEIGKTVNKTKIEYSIASDELDKDKKLALSQLRDNLNLANISLLNNNKESVPKLYIVNEPFPPEALGKHDFFICFANGQTDEGALKLNNFIDFSDHTNYYFNVFSLVQKIINKPSVDELRNELNSEYVTIQNAWRGRDVATTKPVFSLFSQAKPRLWLFVCLILLVPLVSLLYKKKQHNISPFSAQQHLIHSDLRLPNDDILLDRTEVMSAISKKFENKKAGINVVALVGIGGSGKSTLARKYAKMAGVSMVWEINAETEETILASVQQLAYALCSDPEEKEELRQIQLMQDKSDRKRSLYLFLSKKVKDCKDWLIIYDNVKSFKSIEEHFPYDTSVWGNGKVIITTNDYNIAHSNYFPSSNIIYVNALSPAEKNKLFSELLGKDPKSHKSEEYLKCLDGIPPFPLDISIAAHYIKETKIPCDNYLEHTYAQNENFLSAQKNILSDMGEYYKTRYDIIIGPVKHILQQSEDFKQLLLLISLIDAQHIPKDLLLKYSDRITLDNFLHELNKFSLILGETEGVNNDVFFSIHSSTQNIILTYFLNSKELVKGFKELHNIATSFDDYIKQVLPKHDLAAIQALVPHIEAFISNGYLFGDIEKANIYSKLGVCYFYLGAYAKSETLLKMALEILKKHYKEDSIEVAQVMARLGSVRRNVDDSTGAKALLEQAFMPYSKYYGNDHLEMAWILTYLSSVYRSIGDYDKAKTFLKKAQAIYKKHYPKDHIKIAWNLAYLGQTYKDMGNYTKARPLLEQSLATYERHYGKGHTKTAWLTVNLASVYRCIGELDKARILLKNPIEIYKNYYTENSREFAWSTAHLGIVYRDAGEIDKAIELLARSLEIYGSKVSKDNIFIGWIQQHLACAYKQKGAYKEALELLDKSLKTHESHYGNDHVQTAQVLDAIAQAHIAIDSGNAEIQKYINKSLAIFNNSGHQAAYKPLETLADYHLAEARKYGSTPMAKQHMVEASKYLVRAFDMVQDDLPKNSAHIKRLQAKMP